MKFNVLIVEDELLIANYIKQAIELENFNAIGIVKSYNEAIAVLSNRNDIDIILLDVNIYGTKNGVDLAKTINKEYYIPFVFLTSYTDKKTLCCLKETMPVGYLSKPINQVDLITSLQIACNNITKKTFVLTIGGTIYNIVLKDILYIKSDHIYLDIITVNTIITVRSSLSNMLDVLPKNTVLQINRSVAINPLSITKITKKIIEIEDTSFSVSKSYSAVLNKILHLE